MQRKPWPDKWSIWYCHSSELVPQLWTKTVGLPAPQSLQNSVARSRVSRNGVDSTLFFASVLFVPSAQTARGSLATRPTPAVAAMVDVSRFLRIIIFSFGEQSCRISLIADVEQRVDNLGGNVC